jgi:molybdenum cofactor cytidylyltransferase
MGTSKPLLPWTESETIVEHIVGRVARAGISHIVVVTGFRSGEVAELVEKLGARAVFNPEYETGEMLSSLKAGLRALPESAAAALIVLGDQPGIRSDIVARLLAAYAEEKGDLIVPSDGTRRGHPVLVARCYWPEFIALPEGSTPRDVIQRHGDRIFYVPAGEGGLPADVDTPEEYERERGRGIPVFGGDDKPGF